MNPESTKSHDPTIVKVALPAKRRHIPNLFGWSFVAFAVFVLGAMILPFSNTNCARSQQTRSLAQAKQIGLMLKIFAGDNDGNYPRQGVPAEMTKAPTTSNAAFAPLLPTYTTSEHFFGNKLSAYQTAGPDDVIDHIYTGTPVKTLEPGENVYAYVMGLTEKSSADTPIVLDGTNDGDLLHYNSDRRKRGGVWEGKQAVIIYLDNHGTVGNLKGPPDARYVEVERDGRSQNALDLSFLGSDVHLLNPAVAP